MLDALQTQVRGTTASVFIPAGPELQKAIYTHSSRPWAYISKGEQTRLRALVAKLVKQKL